MVIGGDKLLMFKGEVLMEVLTLMLQRRVRDSGAFTFHCYYSEMDLINLCFADDLFLFAHGDKDSARVIMEALDEFKLASGLTLSIPKSTAYFCNVLNYIKISILHIMLFEEGRLLVKYLGVPLVSSRLLYWDCKELIEKVYNRIKDWRNKSLSAARRLQLVQSVIGSMHVYWASVFILPTCMLLEIENGYIKNHKKTVKNRQARTRESEEYKAKARKVKPQSKSAKKSQSQSKMIKLKYTSAMVKHTRDVGFALNSLTKEAQAVTSRNDSLAILECTQFDQTATIEAPMIKRFDGQD
ncbi:hypothetical protein Tco_0282564 [Tanacetum coccineum]